MNKKELIEAIATATGNLKSRFRKSIKRIY